jgi:acetyl esterase/lipase
MSWFLFGLALFNLTSVLCMFHPRPVARGFTAMLAICWFSLLGTELAWAWLALQIGLALAFIAGGALDSAIGVLGLCILLLSWPGLGWRHWQGLRHTREAIEDALTSGLGKDFLEAIPVDVQRRFRTQVRFRDWAGPLSFSHPDVERISNIPYLPGGTRQHLDIYRPINPPGNSCPSAGRPVLLQLHGGAWMMGHKGQQALSLMYHMAANGWICVSANYRLSPSVGFPTHLEDCKSALCWIREHGEEYGMNPEFVAVTGGSAGGHLTALMGLTANRADLQKLHPDTDTSVQACVPFYGEYDFRTSHSEYPNYELAQKLLTENIMHVSQQDDPALWELASPITQIREQAPPFMVIHGDMDSLLPVANARDFASELRNTSASPVVYAEIPGAEHGFEILRTVRAEHAIDRVHRFLEWARAQQLKETAIE